MSYNYRACASCLSTLRRERPLTINFHFADTNMWCKYLLRNSRRSSKYVIRDLRAASGYRFQNFKEYKNDRPDVIKNSPRILITGTCISEYSGGCLGIIFYQFIVDALSSLVLITGFKREPPFEYYSVLSI